MQYTDKDFKEALLKRAIAKNSFEKINNDETSSREDLWESYKKYRQADDEMMRIYERIIYERKVA